MRRLTGARLGASAGICALALSACGGSGAGGATSSSDVAPRTLAVSTPTAAGTAPADNGTASATPAHTASTALSQRITFVPKQIQLADASASVLTTDTLANGELQIPQRAATVGWWQSGAMAGDLYGGVVLAGHIDSAQDGLGYFVKLLALQPGDLVRLRDAEYEQDYRVTTQREIAKAELSTRSDAFSQTVPGRLVLLTCSGTFDSKTGHYDHNLVVFADPEGTARPIR